jgi:group I intron endonuclease
MLRKKICGIYKITSPSGKIYIGQSIDIIKRWGYYKRMKCKSQVRLFHSFSKHGAISHNFEIVHECQRNELNELECKYIKQFNSFDNINGLNLMDGGRKGTKVSDETKYKLRIANLGKKRSLESINKVKETIKNNGGAWNKGMTGIFSEEALKKIGVRHSQESINKIGEKARGRIQSEEHKKKNSDAVKRWWLKRKELGISTWREYKNSKNEIHEN